jgi:hypothetical protein
MKTSRLKGAEAQAEWRKTGVKDREVIQKRYGLLTAYSASVCEHATPVTLCLTRIVTRAEK